MKTTNVLAKLNKFPRTMKITVTQKDIEDGLHGSCELCPISLAAVRHSATRGLGANLIITSNKLLEFGTTSPFDDTQTTWVVYRLPRKAQNFIRDYDNRMCIEPFSFHATMEVA